MKALIRMAWGLPVVLSVLGMRLWEHPGFAQGIVIGVLFIPATFHAHPLRTLSIFALTIGAGWAGYTIGGIQ